MQGVILAQVQLSASRHQPQQMLVVGYGTALGGAAPAPAEAAQTGRAFRNGQSGRRGASKSADLAAVRSARLE